MQHAGHFDIHHVQRCAVELGRETAAPRAGPADDFVFVRRLGFGPAFDQQNIAVAFVAFELHIKMFAADQLGIRHFFAALPLSLMTPLVTVR